MSGRGVPRSRSGRPADRGHRVAIEQEGRAEVVQRRLDESFQRPVIGPVERVDAAFGLGKGHLRRVDFGARRDQAGDGAEARAHPVGAGLHVARQRLGEHLRVELVGLAVGVQIGARIEGAEERRPAVGSAGEDFVDEAVLGAPQVLLVEPGAGDEGGVVGRAAVGGGEDERRRPARRQAQVDDPVDGRRPVILAGSPGGWSSSAHPAGLEQNPRSVIRAAGLANAAGAVVRPAHRRHGRLAQGESACLTCKRSLVQIPGVPTSPPRRP